MALILVFFLLQLFSLGISEQPTSNPTNQTDLQVALGDMRSWSYHGFVLLLKLVNSTPNFLYDEEITFLMPRDEELSKINLTIHRLEEFVKSHSIPTSLMLSHLLHFPTGTLVPSGIPNRMLNITNSGRSGLFVNNARLISPNVCLNSLIRCHGISTTIAFDHSDLSSPLTTSQRHHPLRGSRTAGSPNAHAKASSESSLAKRVPGVH